MSAHTHFEQGQHVVVHLKSGERFRDKFHERKSTYVVLRDRGRIPVRDLRAISIDRKH